MAHSNNALAMLLPGAVQIYLYLVIARWLLDLARADFFNPIARGLAQLTEPPLAFLRRFVPGLYGFELAAPVFIIALGMIKLICQFALAGQAIGLSGVAVISVASALNQITWMLLLAMLARVVMSWLAPHSRHAAMQIVYALSEPILAPFRRFLPAFGGLDFSPIAAFFALRLAQQLIITPLFNFGVSLV